jgi:superfamily II RNA helicase
MNKLILKIDRPALFFVFSRKQCESFADQVTADLLTSSETADVQHIVKFHLRNHSELQTIPAFHRLFDLLRKGIAFHHSGMIPILKEIVEILFDKGFIKILFATETFAVGINMPTKTVVFTSYRKYDDKTEGMRVLHTPEYIQMAGRAGRRGKDDKGIVIYLPIREPEDPLVVQTMFTGKRATVESQMKFDYSYILAMMASGKDVRSKTYWAAQESLEIDSLNAEIGNIDKQLESFDETVMTACEERRRIQNSIQQSVNAEKRKYQTELSKWDNSHMGPKWENGKKSYTKYRELIDKKQQLLRELENSDKLTKEITARINFLTANEFVKENTLTQKGVLASEVHEGHPLLMAEIYSEKLLDTNTLVQTLSCFLEEPKNEEIIPSVNNITQIEYIAKQLLQPDEYKLTHYWYEVIQQWLEGNDFVCEKYGIEHGNFSRAILKLANIVREWVSMATIKQDTDTIEKMIGIEQKLVRGFIIPDSLYLRI